MNRTLLLAAIVFAGVVSGAQATAITSDAQPKDFPAQAFAGTIHRPNFKGANHAFATYRTHIREGVAGGPNFAGHLALVTFGCGSGCNTTLVADLASGKLGQFPLGGEDYLYLNLAYDKTSRLVAANWMKNNRCLQEKLVWDGAAFSASPAKDIGDQAVCDKLSGL